MRSARPAPGAGVVLADPQAVRTARCPDSSTFVISEAPIYLGATSSESLPMGRLREEKAPIRAGAMVYY